MERKPEIFDFSCRTEFFTVRQKSKLLNYVPVRTIQRVHQIKINIVFLQAL